jgi:hypothetical protein
VDWHEGLRSTVEWYLQNGFNDYWDNGDVEQVRDTYSFPLLFSMACVAPKGFKM